MATAVLIILDGIGVGRAPDGLRWELGVRPGVTPRMVFRSGEIRTSA